MNIRTLTSLTLGIATLGLGACASTPDYVAADSAGDHGYYTTKLDTNRYRVVYNGRASMPLATARDYALLRAAELTMSEGQDWFQVVDRESVTGVDRKPGTEIGYEESYHVDRNCGLLGCTETVHPETRTRIGVDNSREVRTVSHSLEIVMGSGPKPSGNGAYYDANTVAQSLWASM